MAYYHESKELTDQFFTASIMLKDCLSQPDAPDSALIQLKARIMQSNDYYAALVVSQEWNEIGGLVKCLNLSLDMCAHIKSYYNVKDALCWERKFIDLYDLLNRIHDNCNRIYENEMGMLP